MFLASGATAGAGAGLLAAVLVGAATSLLAITGPAVDRLLVSLIVAGVVLDVIRLATGRLTPMAVGRQVPREWAALLPARATAVLYGLRLGIGPLTILSTWTWWSVTLAAGLLSPWSGAVVGATFGGVRMLVMIVVSTGLRPDRHVEGYGLLRARTGRGWRTLNGLGALFVGATVLIGCASNDRPTLVAPAERPAADEPATDSTGPTAPADATTPTEAAAPAGQVDPRPNVEQAARPAIRPATLEDVVRTDLDPGAPETTEDPTVQAVDPAEAIDLGTALIGAVDGYRAIDDPAADRFLDLTAAAAVQPDPTEEVALLETRGFRGGWVRAFRNEANDVAVATVYEFEDAGEAEFYLEDGLITIGGYGGKFFDVDGMPGVRGFIQTEEADPAAPDAGPAQGPSEPRPLSLGAAFQHGSRWYLVYFVGSTATIGADELLPVIEQQRALALATPGD